MSTLDTYPATIQMTTKDQRPVNVDFTNYLSGTDSINISTIAAVLLYQVSLAQVSNPFVGNPALSGNKIQVTLNGAQLAVGQTYVLVITATVNTNKTLSSITTVQVPL